MTSRTKPTIEPAVQADIEVVTELWVRLARDQRGYGSFVRAANNRTTMRETLAAHLHADGLRVARVDGTVVGFVSFSIEQGTLELDAVRGLVSNIYVEPAHRGHEIGTALLETAERALAERGATVVILEVMAENEAARRFYEQRSYDTYRIGMTRRLSDRSESDTHSKEDS